MAQVFEKSRARGGLVASGPGEFGRYRTGPVAQPASPGRASCLSPSARRTAAVEGEAEAEAEAAAVEAVVAPAVEVEAEVAAEAGVAAEAAVVEAEAPR